MNFTKKMTLVDYDLYQRLLQQQQQPKPITNILSEKVMSLDDEISQILQDESIPVEKKATKYEQALHHYKRVKEDYHAKPLGKLEIVYPEGKPKTSLVKEEEQEQQPSTLKFSQTDDYIISTLPKAFKRKGELLLSHLKQDGNLTWDQQGRVFKKGQEIRHANIIDLVHDVIRTRKRRDKPEGFEEFAKVLKRSNIANELIGNKQRQDYLKSAAVPSGSSSSYSSSSSYRSQSPLLSPALSSSSLYSPTRRPDLSLQPSEASRPSPLSEILTPARQKRKEARKQWARFDPTK